MYIPINYIIIAIILIGYSLMIYTKSVIKTFKYIRNEVNKKWLNYVHFIR